MDADATIDHLINMGVLDTIVRTEKGRPLIILASACEAYATRCMKDLCEIDGYYFGLYGIDAVTTDGVPVKMTFIS